MLICFAAVAPWMNGALYKTGAYWAVHLAVGDLVDWVCMFTSDQVLETDIVHIVEHPVLQPGYVHRLQRSLDSVGEPVPELGALPARVSRLGS
jgi:hypothetical protein